MTNSAEIELKAREMYDVMEVYRMQNWHSEEDHRKYIIGCLVEMAEFGRIIERTLDVKRKKKVSAGE